MTYENDIKKLSKRLSKLSERIEKGAIKQSMLISIGRTWQAFARMNATKDPKVDTGVLRDSLQFRLKARTDGMTLEVGSYGVIYAAIHEFGGTIRPKNGKYLVFPENKRDPNAAMIFARQVVIREKRYMRKALEKTAKLIPDIIRRHWRMGLRYA